MSSPGPLLANVRQLINAARQSVAVAVNAELTQLHWQSGRCVSTELLQGRRAGYGKQLMAAPARQLAADFGKGRREQQLRHCVRLAEGYPQEQILSTLRREMSWLHLKGVNCIDASRKRDFHLAIRCAARWNVCQLQERINSLLIERTTISKNPEETVRQDNSLLRNQGQLSPDVVRFADFYGRVERR